MQPHQVLSVIHRAKLEGLDVVTLNGNQLGELPPEIGQLVNLTSLNLDGNPLESRDDS